MWLDPDTRAALRGLEGLISEEVGLALADLAAAVVPPEVIVEIGSYKGKSTAYLAAGARAGRGAAVYAVDPWDTPGNAGGRFGFDQPGVRLAFRRQLDSVGLWAGVRPCQGFSADIAPGLALAIGLLYIDGSHKRGDVWTDWHAWSPKLAPGAVVAFDDYGTPRNPGVARVVDAVARSRPGRGWAFCPAPLAIGFL